jgi:hypothetical protein
MRHNAEKLRKFERVSKILEDRHACLRMSSAATIWTDGTRHWIYHPWCTNIGILGVYRHCEQKVSLSLRCVQKVIN